MNESQTMYNIAKGDAAALQAFSLHFGNRMFATAYRLLGNRASAEDAVQEALIKVWQNAPKWDESKGQPFTWTYRILTNVCMDMLRKNKKSLHLDEVLELEDENVLHALEVRLDMNILSTAMQKMNEKQRIALVLTYMEGFTNKETAHSMGINVKAVETLLVRGRKYLRDKCGEKVITA